LKALLLAAGSSQRMGQPKQLLNWQNKTILQRSLETLQHSGLAVDVILGANSESIKATLAKQVSVLINPQWSEGIGSSIAHAVKHLEAEDDAVLIMLADQIDITKQDIQLLISTWQKNPQQICCSYFLASKEPEADCTENILTVPAIFPKAYFTELANLGGNVGARTILQRERNKLSKIHLINTKTNINTFEQWQYWQQQQAIVSH